MKHLRLWSLLATALCAWSPRLSAQLREGDRIVFCGDSITDQKTYTRLVMDYFALRHPGLPLVFFNAGITGSTAGGWRKGGIQKHVLPLKPTVVTICLGMNDGGYRPYDQKIVDQYEANLLSLIADIKAGDARVVLLTPGAVDDDTLPARYGKGIYNEMLDHLAKRVEAIAAREKIPVFNIHNLMVAIQERAKAQNPAFTMTPDGVHPGEIGATVMAYGMLKALGSIKPAASLQIDAKRKVTRANLCSVRDLTVTADRVTFTRTDLALPTHLSRDAVAALQAHTTICEEMNQYRFAITGLDRGAWKLQVEDTLVGEFTADDLAQGINLGNAPGPWQHLAKTLDRLSTDASHVYDVVFHGLSARHFPQPTESASSELRQHASEIEAARTAYIKKVIAIYEADERKRSHIPEKERTWRWTLMRVP